MLFREDGVIVHVISRAADKNIPAPGSNWECEALWERGSCRAWHWFGRSLSLPVSTILPLALAVCNGNISILPDNPKDLVRSSSEFGIIVAVLSLV